MTFESNTTRSPDLRRRPLRKLIANSSIALTIALSSVTVVGCADGPFYEMKKLSPWHQREWRKDRELGPTYGQRLEELELLSKKLPSMSTADKERWTTVLEKLATKDTSPEIRGKSVTLLARIDSTVSTQAINKAAGDDVEKVRLAACKALAVRKDTEARNMLMSLAETDESAQVRQAAISGLAHFDDEEVRKTLANVLDDTNPAVQHQAVLALRSMTGKDYGGDFDSWRKFVGGEDVAEPPKPSFTARMMSAIPWVK